MASSKTWTIEMFWKCKCCNTICPGITGDERSSLKCKNCGNEKTDEEWIMPDDLDKAPVLTGNHDKIARSGENWSCQYCKSESRNSEGECAVCGASANNKDTDDSDDYKYVKPLETRKPATINPTNRIWQTPVNVSSSKTAKTSFSEYDDSDFLPMKKFELNSETVFKFVLIGGGIAVFIYLLVWLFMPIKTNVVVQDMQWERIENLEERHLRHGEGWRRSAPSSAFDFNRCEQRQNGTENCHPYECNVRNESYECNCTGGDSYSCNCHTTCSSNRNGSATCSESCSTCRTPVRCSTCTRRVSSTCYEQCPTYAEHCRYSYYTWDVIDTARLSGHKNRPLWPNVRTIENQRIQRSDSYEVIFLNNNSPHQRFNESMNEGEFVRFNVGQRWEVEYTRGTGISKYIRLISR